MRLGGNLGWDRWLFTASISPICHMGVLLPPMLCAFHTVDWTPIPSFGIIQEDLIDPLVVAFLLKACSKLNCDGSAIDVC